MTRKPAVGLLLAVAIAAGALFFLLSDDGAQRGPVDEALATGPEPGVPASPSAEVAPAAELEAVTALPPSERRVATTEKTPLSATEFGDGESFDVADAHWVDVHVTLPDGVPLTDEIALLAFSTADDDLLESWEDLSEFRGVDLSSKYFDAESDEYEWARREVKGSGTIRIPFTKDATRGALLVQSRYVYADQVAVDLPKEKTATVEGALGAYVTGRIVIPKGAEDRGLTPEDFDVDFHGRKRETGFFGGSGADSRDVRIADDMTFELRAISADYKYLVTASADGLVDHMEMSFKAEPGEHRRYDIALAIGATISGRLTDPRGEPIEGGRVTAASKSMGMMFRGGNADSEETDADGRFLLTGVPAGKVNVTAAADGWRDGEEQLFEVSDGQTLSGVELMLERGNQVTGRVLWPDGRPAAGARVTASKKQRGGWSSVAAEKDADEDGAFELSGLEEGPFEIVALLAPGGAKATPELPDELADVYSENLGVDLDAITIGSKYDEESAWRASRKGVLENTSGVVLTLEEPLSITGFVVDDAKKPVASSFTITANPAGSPVWGDDGRSSSFETEDGGFTLLGVFPGNWVAHAEAEGYSSPEDGVPFTIPHSGDPIVIVLDRAVTVRGTVVDPSGTPIADAEVTASAGGDSRFDFGDETETTTDADGSFELANCAPDGLTLVASHEDWAASEAFPIEATPGQDVPEIVLTLRVGATITGEVFKSDGSPDAGVAVNASQGSNFGFFGGDEGSTTNASGYFVLERVTPGKVTVTAMPDEEEFMEKMASAEDQMAAMEIFGKMRMESVEVADGEEVHLVLGSKPKDPVRVFGRVSEAGEALAEHTVLVIEEGGAILQGMKLAKTDSDGHYSLSVDRPGSYMFGVGRDAFGDSQSQFFVDVPEAPEFKFDLVIPLGKISGIVVDGKGAPLSGINVRLSKAAGIMGLADLDDSNSQNTGDDGRFTFSYLDPGEYSISAGGEARFFTENTPQFGARVVDGLYVEKNEHLDGIRIGSTGAGKLTGVARDKNGVGVPRASIFVRDADGRVLSHLGTCVTNGTGRFTYTGVPVGRVSVSARSANLSSRDIGPIEIDEGRDSEIEIPMAEACFLIVTLLEDGEPVRARLSVLDDEGRQMNGLVSLEQMESFVTEGFDTKERRVGPLPPGKYTLFATGPDGKDTKKSVTVREGQTERKVKLRLK